MRVLRYKYLLYIFLILGFGLTACRSKQRVVSHGRPVADKENSVLFSDMIINSFHYSTLSSKLNMQFTNGSRTLSSKADIAMVRDRAIRISVQPLFGVEMFRFYIDPDTVLLLDRMNKCYVKESILSLKEHYPVGFDFHTLQSIFTNSLFLSGKSTVEDSDYSRFNYSQTADQNFYLTATDTESDIEYSFTVNGDDRIIFTDLASHKRGYFVRWAYSNFVLLDNSLFPHKMRASVLHESVKIDVEFLFSGVVTDEPAKISTPIPESYTKTSIGDILKIISSDQ